MMNRRHARNHQVGPPSGLCDGPRQPGVVAADRHWCMNQFQRESGRFPNLITTPVVRQNSIADRKEDRTRIRSGLLGVVVLGVPGNLAGQRAHYLLCAHSCTYLSTRRRCHCPIELRNRQTAIRVCDSARRRGVRSDGAARRLPGTPPLSQVPDLAPLSRSARPWPTPSAFSIDGNSRNSSSRSVSDVSG